jgi:predicted nucleic acid-binding protein
MLGAELDGWGSKRRTALYSLIESSYTILPIDLKTSACYVQLMAGSAARGRHLSDPDAWIAATAMQYGMTLLTHDGDMKVADEFGVRVICRR